VKAKVRAALLDLSLINMQLMHQVWGIVKSLLGQTWVFGKIPKPTVKLVANWLIIWHKLSIKFKRSSLRFRLWAGCKFIALVTALSPQKP
jgi:hypothetical protein